MKIHERFFQLLIFTLPFQLGHHFWPAWALVRGLRVDYLAPTIYLTDLILIAVLLFWLLEEKPQFKFSQKQYLAALLATSLLVLNITFAVSPILALLKFLRLVEFLLFYFYLQNARQPFHLIRKPLSLAIAYTFILSVLQLYYQKTIGGPFYWLGERTFTSTTPGIAKFTLLSHQYLRPYATFPHPNTLAGFMLVSGLLLFPSPVSFLALLLVFFSFSQNAWLAVLIIFALPKKLFKTLNPRSPRVFSDSFVLIILSFLSPFIPHFLDLQRQALSFEAFKLFSRSPLFGVGLGNSIPAAVSFQSSYLLQPVHNFFLLILTETGLAGLLLTFFLLSKLTLSSPLLAILLTGLFDHYWLTQPQTQLLLVLVLAFAKSKLLK